MKMSSRLMAAAAVLVMGGFVADQSRADGSYEGPKNRAEAHAGSKSGGIAVKGLTVYSHYGIVHVDEASLAGQKNWSNAKASGPGTASAKSGAFGGSTAKTDSTSDQSYGDGPEAASSSESPSDGCGCGGTSASSFGGSSASASVGGGGKYNK